MFKCQKHKHSSDQTAYKCAQKQIDRKIKRNRNLMPLAPSHHIDTNPVIPKFKPHWEMVGWLEVYYFNKGE